MTAPEQRTEADIKIMLAATIGQWVDDQISSGNQVPDFWDELDTSTRLAEHLVQLGWHQ